MYDRRNHAKRLLFGGILLGNIAAVFLALVEVVFLLAWEGGARTVGMSRTVLFYDALVILVAGPFVGLLFGTLASTVHLIATRVAGQRRKETIWKARLHTILAIPVVSYLAVKAFGGPWASSLPGSRILSMATGGLMLLGTYVASRVIVHHGERLAVAHSGRWMRRLAAPTMLGLAACLYVADQVVLPRLYPFFHWGLAGLTLLAAWLGVGALHLAFDRSRRRLTGRLAKPLAVGLLSTAVLVASMVGHRAIGQRRKRVLFVLTADHGEEFGEHGGANHGTSVFDEQVRVPLLFAGPGLPDRQVDMPVSLTTVSPSAPGRRCPSRSGRSVGWIARERSAIHAPGPTPGRDGSPVWSGATCCPWGSSRPARCGSSSRQLGLVLDPPASRSTATEVGPLLESLTFLPLLLSLNMI